MGTNRDIVMQIVTSEITGDKVFCAAYSHELRAYGIEHGLTNWAAAYCTGLLIARRVLKKLGMDEDFAGVEEADGEYKLTEAGEDEDSRRPFKAFLDVGLARTSTGARIFGAMKGASDGGILIPHSEYRFPGYDIESKELDADPLRKYIFGGHVAEYMETLADDDEERYKSQFQGYIDDEIEADGLEELSSSRAASSQRRRRSRESRPRLPSSRNKLVVLVSSLASIWTRGFARLALLFKSMHACVHAELI